MPPFEVIRIIDISLGDIGGLIENATSLTLTELGTDESIGPRRAEYARSAFSGIKTVHHSTRAA